ncbi:MAG: hydroxymethylbilane synthase, partial [Gemmatimonadota bacterium]
LKNVETAMPDGLEIGAVLEREDPRDVLIARDGLRLDALPEGAVIGTSSLRRSAFLRRWRPDLTVRDLRGNVPTRIEKLDAGHYDAIVLAAAGVKRLGRDERITDYFTHDILLPAVSQGAIAVQLRSDDERVGPLVASLDHPPTRAATTAERALLRTVEGGCQVPVGAHATADGDTIHLRGTVCSLDGQQSVAGEARGSIDDPEALGIGLARELLGRGGDEILRAIRALSAD